MARPAELRDQSRQFRRAAERETTRVLSQALISHALALDYLAEKIECEEAIKDWPITKVDISSR